MFIDGPVDQPLTRADADPLLSPVRWGAIGAGIFFLVIGFAGFVPTLTLHMNEIAMGYGSGAMVLGIFQVSVLHNLVHILLGLAGFALSRRTGSARTYLRGAAVVCAVLWVFGLLVAPGAMANFVPLNAVDTWAYLVLAAVMVGLSFLPAEPSTSSRTSLRHA